MITKKYLKQGTTIYCDGCYLNLNKHGNITFETLGFDGGLWYEGKTVEWDLDGYYIEIEVEDDDNHK